MTMITPSYLGETIEYSSLHACRSTLEDPTSCANPTVVRRQSTALRLFIEEMAPPAMPFWTVAPDLSNRWG